MPKSLTLRGEATHPVSLASSGPEPHVGGIFWYAYVIVDVWSREIVGWSIHPEESEEHARALFERLRLRRDLKGNLAARRQRQSDEGHHVRGVARDAWDVPLALAVACENDNPYIESFFKTVKYHASYPGRCDTIEAAREWLGDFIHWYNTVHRHSGIGYVTPEQPRTSQSSELFELRNQTLLEAWERHLERFPRKGPRLWKEQRVVYLNPSAETRRPVINKAA